MSLKHEFTCNSCGQKAEAEYNGAHYIAPKGWTQLWDDQSARLTNVHLCPNCHPNAAKIKPDLKREAKPKGSK